jgi:phospholipid/cholesterol/gamma-HCH transport system substrate-binding protein
MTRLDSAVTALLVNLNKTSENLNALLDADNRRAFKKTLVDLETLSNTLAARSKLIDSSLVDAAHTMKNTARLTDELTQLGPRVQRSADAFDRMSNQLRHAGASAGSTLDSTRQFTNETLPEVQKLVTQLRDLTGSLQRISDQIEQNPSVLVYGKPAAKRGPGE